MFNVHKALENLNRLRTSTIKLLIIIIMIIITHIKRSVFSLFKEAKKHEINLWFL